ncbi:hypothetical protein V1477_005291 [Vespula maculifrons]|uniref:Uncharacterized protein n=1 Tax=Vespula maculifrons TaxID=7453 RepID=A0ABD2CP92_VESMC
MCENAALFEHVVSEFPPYCYIYIIKGSLKKATTTATTTTTTTTQQIMKEEKKKEWQITSRFSVRCPKKFSFFISIPRGNIDGEDKCSFEIISPGYEKFPEYFPAPELGG